MYSVLGQDVSPFVQDVDFGNYSLDDVYTLRHGAFQTHSAGFLSMKTVTMTILSPSSNLVTDYFQAWKNLMIDPSGFYFPKRNYANFSAIVCLYDCLGNQVDRYRLANIFPKTFPNFKLSYAEEGMVKFNIEFSVDFIERV